VIVGEAGRTLAGSLGAFGVSTVRLAIHGGLGDYAPAAWGRSIAELASSLGPAAVLAAGTDRGNEVMAHAAAMTSFPMAANVVTAEPGEDWGVTRVRWGGSLLEEARLHDDVKLLTVAPHVVRAEEAAPTAPEVVEFTPALSEQDLLVRVVDRVAAETGKVSLPTARVVVGGGRGVGSAEGFAVLEELAELLGAAVGCSRVVTSLGWRPHADQVGQTGTRIAPDLYIACGISGAIQHMVGAKAAKRILAINTDRDAPIMSQADYAVVGDLHAILPTLVQELRKTTDA
jgi:electron transfer flavoprotein alpha subunit